MLYKALGFAVWKGAKWYLGRRLPSRRVLLGGMLAVGIVTAAAVGARKELGS